MPKVAFWGGLSRMLLPPPIFPIYYRRAMLLSDLDYNYPDELVALEPRRPSRVLLSQAGQVSELTKDQLLCLIQPRDLLVINNTKVMPARIFSLDQQEILFVRELDPLLWQVLFPARDVKIGSEIAMPGGLKVTLLQKGLPQTVQLSQPLSQEYFSEFGELALPPYIQDLRKSRHNVAEDLLWYQTAWAKYWGSTAAPTASLHFSASDFEKIPTAELTLHVGPGTFLPVKTNSLSEHQMHGEWVDIPVDTIKKIQATKANGGRVWALGTTVARSLESWQLGLLQADADGVSGMSGLFIYPPYEFKVVDCLLTNFHQPRSTLLALVAAFAGLKHVQNTYQWAIQNRFRLFSYGDLSAWIK